jgi:hypothetical protein
MLTRMPGFVTPPHHYEVSGIASVVVPKGGTLSLRIALLEAAILHHF